MGKRISVRGIIIVNNEVYTIYRRRIKRDGITQEYYVIPGGGMENGENLQETLKRELKEELSIDVDVIGYLGSDENNDSIAHFFKCRILKGIPMLGGEELERCSRENYYEVRKVDIHYLDSIDILAKDIIMKAYYNEFVKL